jgi:hypothetical protein
VICAALSCLCRVVCSEVWSLRALLQVRFVAPGPTSCAGTHACVLDHEATLLPTGDEFLPSSPPNWEALQPLCSEGVTQRQVGTLLRGWCECMQRAYTAMCHGISTGSIYWWQCSDAT